MIRITNIFGLVLLNYLWYHHGEWNISINETNMISAPIVAILQKIPPFIISTIFTVSIILYVFHIVKRSAPYLVYTITLILLHVLTKISISYLMLEDTTTFIAFKVHHPIPYELQLYHFEYSMFYLIENYCPELFTNKQLIYELQLFLKDSFDVTKIKDKNAAYIFSYAAQLLNEFHIKHNIGWCNFPVFAIIFMFGLVFVFFKN